MKRIQAQGMTQIRVNAKDGFCVLHLLEGPGETAEVQMPIPVLERAAAEVRRGKLSYQARQEVLPPQSNGDLQGQLPLLKLHNADVTVEPLRGDVVLILDEGMETQLAFRIPPDAAKQIADLLADQSERCRPLRDAPKQ